MKTELIIPASVTVEVAINNQSEIVVFKNVSIRTALKRIEKMEGFNGYIYDIKVEYNYN